MAKKKVRICRVCHGIDGVGRDPTVPNVASERALYFAKRLRVFRSDARKHKKMTIIAGTLSDADIANLAVWHSAIELIVKLPE